MKTSFIDVHCHLDLYNSISDLIYIIDNAKKVDVSLIISNGLNPNSNRKTLEIAKRYSEVKVALGLYPIDALSLTNEDIEKELLFIEKQKNNIIAIGEVGLDFKEDIEHHDKQKAIFERIIELAKRLNKPLLVHSRKAEKECLEILERENAKKVIMHCFSGKFSLIQIILKNNWYLSIPASVLYSEHFQNIVNKVPITSLLCETDSPFLNPKKEGQNEPSFVLESYKTIAKIKNLSIQKVKDQIANNFKRVFYD